MSKLSSTDWRRVASRMRAELDRAATTSVSFTAADGSRHWQDVKLAGRPKELAELVVKATVARGRWQVILPGLEEFGELIGIGKNHIRGVFHVLECARMVALERAEAGWTLTVFPHSGDWRVAWRYEELALLAYLGELDRAPGQVQGELLPPEDIETTAGPAMTRAAAIVSAERAAGVGQPPPVPKMGTSRLTSSQNGNRGGLQGDRETVSQSSQLSQSPSSTKEQENRENRETGKTGKANDWRPHRGQPLTPAQRELLDRVAELLGEEQKREWGNDWVANFIRPMPDELRVALDELALWRKEGREPGRPVHWVKWQARHVRKAREAHEANG